MCVSFEHSISSLTRSLCVCRNMHSQLYLPTCTHTCSRRHLYLHSRTQTSGCIKGPPFSLPVVFVAFVRNKNHGEPNHVYLEKGRNRGESGVKSSKRFSTVNHQSVHGHHVHVHALQIIPNFDTCLSQGGGRSSRECMLTVTTRA